MIKANVLRYAAIGMASLSLAGFAAASTVNVSNTGADSNNKVKLNNSASVTTNNQNLVGVGNFNAQGAQSGDVSAHKNTSAGPATSGAATNANSTDTHVTVNNGASSAAVAALAGFGAAESSNVGIDHTGADSDNKVEVNNERNVNVNNTNVVEVSNVSVQGAKSGDVHADKNTTVGGLTSGAASNVNSTSTSVTVGN